MSKKSTARTGSEGDAESTINDVFVNIRPEASSCKSKREFEGGPFGDSPTGRNRQLLKDYFILMFRDDETTETSEASDVDQELYNLQNDYLEKLNNVRRTLNLLEISDDLESLSPISCDNKCTITEIVDEETESNRSYRKQEEINRSLTYDEPKLTTNEDKSNCKSCANSNMYDVIKIYPTTETFNFESTSAVSILELEYNPPKKKMCHRQKTPKLTSVSDGNLPYYTRIGLHDDVFNYNKCFKGNNTSFWPDGSKFIETKETQCTEEDFRAKHLFGQPNDINLFPEVIIERTTRNISEPSSTSSQTSLKSVSNFPDNKLSLNVIEENSDDSCTTYSTTLESSRDIDIIRKRVSRRNKVSSTEKLTLWEEIRKLHPPNKVDTSNYEIVTIDSDEEVNIGDVQNKKERNDYIGQYLRYKRHMDRVKPGSVPFGTTVAHKHTDLPGSLDIFGISRSSSMTNHGKKKNKKFNKISNDQRENNGSKNYFDKLFCCCRLKRT